MCVVCLRLVIHKSDDLSVAVCQGTMEEKIYDRQVTKETLSQRVIDEHQIDRHFTAADLRELYVFKPDRLDDPAAPKRPIPSVPKVCFTGCSIVCCFKTNNIAVPGNK